MTNIERFETKWGAKLVWTKMHNKNALVIYNKNNPTSEDHNVIALIDINGITYLIEDDTWDEKFVNDFKLMAKQWHRFYFPDSALYNRQVDAVQLNDMKALLAILEPALDTMKRCIQNIEDEIFVNEHKYNENYDGDPYN
jgi:hypothetical protein